MSSQPRESNPGVGGGGSRRISRPSSSKRLLERLIRKQVVSEADPDASDIADLIPLVRFATRVGAIALETGASWSDATELTRRIGWAAGTRLDVDITYTAVSVTAPDAPGDRPLTLRRTVPALGWDYARLAHLADVVDKFCTQQISLTEATAELRRRALGGPAYRTWVVRVAAFMQGASICALLGGEWSEIIFAGLATYLIDVVVAVLTKRKVSYFFAQVVSGAIPTMVAIALMWVRSHGGDFLGGVSPSLVVASGMVPMLAGLGIVSAAQDALNGAYITANARIVDLIMRTGGLILGVVMVLWVGIRLGLPAYLSPSPLPPAMPVVQIISSGLFALVFAIGFRLGPRGALLSGLLGALAWASYLVAMPATGQSHPVASALAALLVTVLAAVLARRSRLPAIALTTLGIAPLMPGMLLYRGLYRLVMGTPAVEPGDAAGALLLLAAVTAIGLALGSSIGGSIGRWVVGRFSRG